MRDAEAAVKARCDVVDALCVACVIAAFRVGPQFGFDLARIAMHYEHRRKVLAYSCCVGQGHDVA